MKSVKILSEELDVSKQTIFNNIKRLNIETIKKENTSFVKNNEDVEKIIERVNENKRKYGFESDSENKENTESKNVTVESQNNDQIVEILSKQIDNLNSQIQKLEDRHEVTIEFYRKELQERSKLLENQQILALESNKKIQKLEHELEEERQLNYSFGTSTSNQQNINDQKSNFTSETEDFNQQQKEELSIEVDHKDILEENENTNEEVFVKNDDQTERIDNADKEIEEKQHKKGFWSRLFGN